MSMVRFSHSINAIADLNNKIRHVYDLHQLLSLDEVNDFFKSDKFENMMLKVGQDDILSFKTDNDWLKIHPKEALLFKSTDATWADLRNTYLNDFKNLVYGTLPDEKLVIETIKKISSRLKMINWNLKVG